MILTKSEELKEIFMIELQGEIQYYDSLDGIHLGKFEENGQKCTLTIGNHNLRGKVENLPKPLLLVQKIANNLQATGVIKKKYTFTERPAPIPDYSNKKLKSIYRT